MRETKPLKIEPDAWCAWCGDPLPEIEERHTRRQYCSRRCRDDASNDRKRQEWAALLQTRNCLHCGVTFKQNRLNQIFCGPRCVANAAYRRKTGRPVAVETRACPGCGVIFTPRTLGQIYCTTPCRRIRETKARGG